MDMSWPDFLIFVYVLLNSRITGECQICLPFKWGNRTSYLSLSASSWSAPQDSPGHGKDGTVFQAFTRICLTRFSPLKWICLWKIAAEAVSSVSTLHMRKRIMRCMAMKCYNCIQLRYWVSQCGGNKRLFQHCCPESSTQDHRWALKSQRNKV